MFGCTMQQSSLSSRSSRALRLRLLMCLTWVGTCSCNRRFAYTTLVDGDNYFRAAVVLAYRLVEVKSRFPLLVLVASNESSAHKDPRRNRTRGNALVGTNSRSTLQCERSLLQHLGAIVREVEPLGLPQAASQDKRWQKLVVWMQTDWERLVFIDLDTFVVRNIDHLFQIRSMFAAAEVTL